MSIAANFNFLYFRGCFRAFGDFTVHSYYSKRDRNVKEKESNHNVANNSEFSR